LADREAAARRTRERLQLVSAEAQLLREAGRTQEAFELLDRNVQTYPDQPDLLYDHGMAAERLDRMPEMERSMRRIIEMRPDSAHAYNALGYSLADRNQRLDEARTLIEKALLLLPDDAHILDSMGWVLFRQKDLEGALKYLNRAWSLSQEADIGAHLGEVLWVSGRQDEARRLWREVNKRDPANTTLRETLTRLNVAL
jgi:Flp pilus assembly protein TadD